MTKLPWAVSVGLILAGLLFAYASTPQYGNRDPSWAYAVTGIVCIGFGATFAILIWNRSTHPSLKAGPKHQLE